MGEDLSLSMVLRLRGNAVALNRTAEQCRRVLRESPQEIASPADTDGSDEAAWLASAADLFDMATKPEPPAPIQPGPSVQTSDRQAAWASKMAEMACEVAARLPGLPPVQPKTASFRSTVLGSSANSPLQPRMSNPAAMSRPPNAQSA
jgi:hypothetical protein